MSETVRVTITGDEEQVREQLIAELSAINFDAFEEKETELAAFIDKNNFDPSLLENILQKHNSLKYDITIIEDQNWNALWESNFPPVVVDDFCAIRADFHEPFSDKEHEIIITPKMSFGTGHHATTYMMISQMSKIDFKNKKVADFGTGTGVLAILAEKLGSTFVWAIDIDDWSIENASENFRKNECKNVLLEKKEGFHPDEKFDIILANINKNVILSNIEGFIFGVTPSAEILLSGLIKEDEKDILDAFKAKGFKHQLTLEKNKWICLLFHFGRKLE